MRSLGAATEAVDVDRHLELWTARTSARAEHVHLVLERPAATGDARGQNPARPTHGRPREEAIQERGVHGRAGGIAAYHVAPDVPAPVGVQVDHPVRGARATHLLAAPVEAADVELRGGAERHAVAGAGGGATHPPELRVDAQADGAVAGRPAAARGARVLRAGAPRAGVAGLGARDRPPAGAGEGAGPGLPIGASRGRGAPRGGEDASAPLTARAHPRTDRRHAAGAALVGAALAGAVLAGTTTARALGARGGDARGEAPLAHDRARDGAAGAGGRAGVAGAGAGVRRGGAGETIAVPHPITITLPPTRLTAGTHTTRRGVGDGARDAPDARATVRLGAARRAPPQVDAGGHVHLTRGARAAEGLTHPAVGRARGTDRHHPRRGGGRRDARVGDAGAGGQLAARQAAQAGGEAVLTHLGAARRPNRGRPNDALVARLTGVERLPLVRAAGGEAHGEKGENQGAEEHPPRRRTELLAVDRHVNAPGAMNPARDEAKASSERNRGNKC